MADTDDDMSRWSKDELLSFIDEMEATLEEKDKRIEELEKENINLSTLNRRKKGSAGGRRDSDADLDDDLARAAVDAELEDLRDKYETERGDNIKLKEKITELNSFMKAVESEKNELEADVRRLRKKADDLENEMTNQKESVSKTLRKSQDISKNQRDAQKQQLHLLEENEKLQEKNAEYLKQIEEAEAYKKTIGELVIQLNTERDSLESDNIAGEVARDTLQNRVEYLETQLDELQNKYHSSIAMEGQLETHMETVRSEVFQVQEKWNADVAKYKEEISTLQKSIVALKDSSSMGAKQREIESLQQTLKDNFALLEEMNETLQTVEHEKEQLIEEVLRLQKDAVSEHYDKLSAANEKNRILEKKMQTSKSRLDEAEARVVAAEKELSIFQREIDSLNNWKTVYESGHGFQELARYQMKLKEDNRRLGLALEQATEKNGEIMDACAMLHQAFEKLKLENGYDQDFVYPEYELRQEMLGENASLKSQVTELEEQISALENDCIRLRKALKNQVLICLIL
jgi:chromosome segregation ATPase